MKLYKVTYFVFNHNTLYIVASSMIRAINLANEHINGPTYKNKDKVYIDSIKEVSSNILMEEQ